MPEDWPLTGRGDELGFVARALRRGGRTRGVLLAGAAGVGKTRLAREALAAAAVRGTRIHWVSATAAAATIPMGCFAHVLRDVRGPVDPMTLLGRTAAALLGDVGRAGAVLAVDDAHLVDDVSATLVHQLVAGGAMPVVLTLRSGEPAPDAITALWKDGHLDRLEVQPLARTDVAALVAAVLSGAVDSRSAERFRESTIVLSYSSNAVPDAETIEAVLGEVKDEVEVRRVEHRYSFGTHAAATRRDVSEYLFIGR